MSNYTSNIRTSVQNEWVIKRIVTSAVFFFGTEAGKTVMKHIVSTHEGELNSSEDIRKMFKIQPHVWAWFMDELINQGLVVREFNGLIGYHTAARSMTRPISADVLIKYVTIFEEGSKGGDSEARRPDRAAEDEFDADSLRAEYHKKIEAIRKASDEAVAEIEAKADEKRTLELTIKDASKPDAAPVVLSSVHKNMPDLLVRIECGINVFLVGPAGSGKTFGAEQVADALDLSFSFMSVGPQTTKSDVFGYMNATGDYVSTEFRRRFEEGGVFLFDEIDAAHPGVLTQINAALAGTSCAFPDGMVKKHADFRCIAAGNTFGTGPDRQYVGRQQMDAASIDRFDFLEWPYDETLELNIARSICETNADKWTTFIQAVRKSIQELGIRHVVSPRATINGLKLLKAGVPENKVRATALWKSLKPDEVTRILAKVA